MGTADGYRPAQECYLRLSLNAIPVLASVVALVPPRRPALMPLPEWTLGLSQSRADGR